MSEARPILAISDAELCAILGRELGARFEDERKIAKLRRQPWDYYSSFTIESLSVEFEDGQSLSLIVKDLGPGGRLQTSAAIKPDFLYDPLREIETYRRILAPAMLDCPEYFGSEINPSVGRYLLFLENVKGIPLWQIGDIEVWRQTARWLAKFHARVKPDADQVLAAKLIRYDESFYSIWPYRAAEFLRNRRDVSSESKVAIDVLARKYDLAIARLMSLPRCMIHGEFVASNILVQMNDRSTRVRVADWEMSAIGPGLMDLADLIAGKWTDDEREQIAGAYRDALPAECKVAPAEFHDALNLCRLHKAMQWLGWSAGWTPPTEQANDWLSEAVRLAQRIS